MQPQNTGDCNSPQHSLKKRAGDPDNANCYCWDMAILSCIGYRPYADHWKLSDVNSLALLGEKLQREFEIAPSPENEERVASWVYANEVWQSGEDIWFVDDEHTLAFAAEPRFVVEEELEYDLDELISDGAYILSAERSDKDLTDPDILEVICTELRLSGLAVLDDDSHLLYDCFARKEEVSSRIVGAIEKWDMEHEP